MTALGAATQAPLGSCSAEPPLLNSMPMNRGRLLLVGAILAVVILLGAVLRLRPRSPVNRENFERIQSG